MSNELREKMREFEQSKIDLFYFIDKGNLRSEAHTLIKLALRNSQKNKKKVMKSEKRVNLNQENILLKLKEYKFTQSKIVKYLKEQGFKISQGAVSQMKNGKMSMPEEIKTVLNKLIKD